MKHYHIDYVIELPDVANVDYVIDALTKAVAAADGKIAGGCVPVDDGGRRIDARTGKAADDDAQS